MAAQRVYALFQDVADAERAIGALEDHGVPRANVGVAARRPAEGDEAARVREGFTRVTDRQDERLGQPVAAYEPQPGTLPPPALAPTAAPASSVDTPQNVEAVGKEGLTTTTPQDAAAGAAVGTGVGLVTGLLAAAAALTIPGLGLVLAGGALAAAAGAAVGTTVAGAAVGGVVGYLRDMGMPEQAASRYADRIAEGDYLVTALIDSAQYDDVKRLLLKYNAAGVDVDVLAAGEAITEARGADPAIAEELRQPPVRPMTAAEAAAAGELNPPAPSNTVLTPAPADTVVTAPPAGPRIVTEALDGTPLIPAQVVDTPAETPVTVPVGRTPDEEAAHQERLRQVEQARIERARQGESPS
ncbi:MAG: hypothetical protein JO250_06655 [Armatimonadetes bacterium]|nr:hypothetical protein [Armatimonadota bacterium]